VAEAATFQGGGLAPNTTLSIALVGPDGGEVRHSVITGPDGSFSHTVSPALPGRHTLRVLDGAGQPVATTDLFASARN
jgi:hypothetical protein